MIYLNQAGTSWPKPDRVLEAVHAALRAPPATWPDALHDAHGRVAAAFGVGDARRLLLTPGCTQALAVAIADHAWVPGDRLLISGLEHHAISRQAALLEPRGVDVDVVPRGPDAPLDLGALEAELARGNVRLVAMTAACNVTGELLPVEDIVRLAHAHDALCLIDGAQVSGWFDLDLPALGIDLFAFAGHKGLHAPWGIGGLYVAPHVETHTPAASCSVSDRDAAPCTPMPGYCDVGSVDRAALAGLAAALDWLDQPERLDRLATTRAHVERITSTLATLPGVTLRGVREPAHRLPSIAFTVDEVDSGDVATLLCRRGLIVAGGLQCAPGAHTTLGTGPDGVVRISAGPTITSGDVDDACEILEATAGTGWLG